MLNGKTEIEYQDTKQNTRTLNNTNTHSEGVPGEICKKDRMRSHELSPFSKGQSIYVFQKKKIKSKSKSQKE